MHQTKLHFYVWNSYSLLSKSWRCMISWKSTQSLAPISVFAPPYPLFITSNMIYNRFPIFTQKLEKWNTIRWNTLWINHFGESLYLTNKKITICIVQCCLQVFWIRCRSIDPNHHINIILHPIYITEVTNGISLKKI